MANSREHAEYSEELDEPMQAGVQFVRNQESGIQFCEKSIPHLTPGHKTKGTYSDDIISSSTELAESFYENLKNPTNIAQSTFDDIILPLNLPWKFDIKEFTGKSRVETDTNSRLESPSSKIDIQHSMSSTCKHIVQMCFGTATSDPYEEMKIVQKAKKQDVSFKPLTVDAYHKKYESDYEPFCHKLNNGEEKFLYLNEKTDHTTLPASFLSNAESFSNVNNIQNKKVSIKSSNSQPQVIPTKEPFKIKSNNVVLVKKSTIQTKVNPIIINEPKDILSAEENCYEEYIRRKLLDPPMSPEEKQYVDIIHMLAKHLKNTGEYLDETLIKIDEDYEKNGINDDFADYVYPD